MTLLTSILVAAALTRAASPEPSLAEGATPSAREAREGSGEAARARSGVQGRMSDAETDEPLMFASLWVKDRAELRAETDADGRYTLPLPPGTYTLSVWYDGYEAADVRGVTIRDGKVTTQDVALGRLDLELSEEVVIVAELESSSEDGALLERRLSSTVQDSLSSEEMSRSADGSAAEAVSRVVSASVQNGKEVVLRGMGGRYATTLVNGVPLPSTDPDGHSVPLDLFPVGLLQSLTVQKSYSAEAPGTFAGGALSLRTNVHPSSFQGRLKLSTGGDTIATLSSRRDYRGGSLDFLGLDDGSRALPASVPTQGPLPPGAIPLSAPSTWTTREVTGLPDLGVSLAVGDTLHTELGSVGYSANILFSHSESARLAQTAKLFADPSLEGGVGTRETFLSDAGGQTGKLGGLLNVGWTLDGGSELTWLSMFSHRGTTDAQLVEGWSENDLEHLSSHRLRFTSRTLWFNQLAGTHRLDGGDLTLRWQADHALTHGTEPDTRDITYAVLGPATRRFREGSGSGERFYSSLTDHTGGLGVHVSLPFGPIWVKTGLDARGSMRSFDARRLGYEILDTADPSVLFLPPEQLFGAQHLGEDLVLRERTNPFDSYEAQRGVFAGFASAEYSPNASLRLEGGLRYELGLQNLTAGSPFSLFRDSTRFARQEHALLPTLNVVHALTPDQNLRAGASYTLARPQLRELAPFSYVDFSRRRNISGNPELRTTRILNTDVRWEWFPAARELLAVGAFYKQLQDPIERVIVNQNDDLFFRNAASAWALGAEIEGRVSLGRVAPALASLHAAANLSLIHSRIQLDAGQQTHSERALQGQAPYAANLNLTWRQPGWGSQLTVLYNVEGPRIVEVGGNGKPDVYEQPLHRVDLTWSQELAADLRLKLSLQNLLNQAVVQQQGGTPVLSYHPGIAGSASLELAF